MRAKWILFLPALLLTQILYSQDIIINPKWEEKEKWNFEKIQIAPTENKTERRGKNDTIYVTGEISLIEKDSSNRNFHIQIRNVRKSSDLTSGLLLEKFQLWQTIMLAGKIEYTLNRQEKFDTIIYFEKLEDAVREYCSLVGYQYFSPEANEENEGFWTTKTRTNIKKYIAETLKTIHDFAGDTLKVGVNKNLENYPRDIGYMRYFDDIFINGLITEIQSWYLYRLSARLDMREVYQSKRTKDGKNESEENISTLYNFVWADLSDYKLTKHTLLPLEIIIREKTQEWISLGMYDEEEVVTTSIKEILLIK